jgi:hypothetical protein
MAISPGRVSQPWRTQYCRGPGSAGDAHPTLVDDNRRHSQWPRNFNAAIARQIEFREHLTTTLDDGFFGDTGAPCQRK